jgi:hypothetical protein
VKFKLSAGAEIDTMTAQEFRQELASWFGESVKGARPIRFSAQGTITGNAVTVGGLDATANSGRTGPEAGYVWDVRRVAVSGLTNASDPTSLFVNANDALHLILPAFTGVSGAIGYHDWPKGANMLMPNDRLVCASTGSIAATGIVTLVGMAWELPIGQLWRMV